jgi:hypothetical protein
MTDPAAGPADLAALVNKATESLDRVRDSIDREAEVREREVEALRLKYETARRARRRSNAAIAIAIVVLALALVAKYRADRADDRAQVRAAVIACNNANLSRQAIQDEFDVFITALTTAGAQPTTVEATVARQAMIDKFRADFRANTPAALRPRDCSEEAVTSPTVLTTISQPGG